MRPGLVVVAEVFAEDLSEMILAEDDQVVQAFAPDRSDDSFSVGVLPGGLRSGDDLLDAQSRHPVTEPIAVDGVTISEQISGFGSSCRERFDDLLEIVTPSTRSEEHTSELQSRLHLVCRLLLEKK